MVTSTGLWPGSLVKLAAGEVFVRATPAGDGHEPALYVHGLGGSATNWTDLMAQLEPDLAGMALDLPGFGFSPPRGDADFSLSAHAQVVIELIERLGIWPVHLVGNSMGGAIATRVAGRRPDLVRTLILVSPALPDLRPRVLPLRLAVATAPGVGPWLIDRLARVPAQVRTERTIRDLFADPEKMTAERRMQETAEVRRRDELGYATQALIGSARSLVAEYARRGPGSLWHDAARTLAPTLVLHGSHDRLVSPATAGRAARTFKGGRVVVLPEVGHVAMMEQPAMVAGEIRAFLAARARC